MKNEIGRWGRAHEEYLKAGKPDIYSELIHSGNLMQYLIDFEKNAQSRFDLLIEQMRESENVTEALKARDEMLWVGRMNSIRSRAEEVIMPELVNA